MKRIIIIGIVIILFAGIFFTLKANAQRPHEGDTKVALCVANVYAEPSLDSSSWVHLKKGDTFTLTGAHKNADNGKGASYTMWEGTTADGQVGWVKANAFIETDKYGW